MGYRSQVVYALTEEHMKNMINSATDDTAINIVRGTKITVKDNWYLIHYEWAKWYEQFSDVKHIMEFIRNLDDNANDGYEFHRLGEEYDDYEVYGHGNSPFNICMNRSLDWEE